MVLMFVDETQWGFYRRSIQESTNNFSYVFGEFLIYTNFNIISLLAKVDCRKIGSMELNERNLVLLIVEI